MRKISLDTKIFIVLLSALMLMGGFTNEVHAEIPMSEWSVTKTGLPGEESKLQYSYSDVTGYKSTSYKINEESVLSNIYYVDTEYVIYQNGSFLGVGNAYSGDGTAKTYTNAGGMTYRPVQTIVSNKWGFKYSYTTGDDGGRHDNKDMSHYTYSNAQCWGGSCSGHPYGYSYSNTVNVGPQNVTYNPYGDPVFDYRILATGVIGTATNNRSSSPGYRFGINGQELNEVNYNYSSNSCGNKGTGTSMNTSNWCYESRYGNKTYGTGNAFTAAITNTNGVTVYVEGVNGNIQLYENNRKNGEIYNGNTMGSATVNIYGISLIERVYYINTKTNTPRENTVAETWITPEWGPWSAYSDTVAYASATRKVRTRTLYRHPLTYTVNFHANGGEGTMPSFTCYYGSACKLPANTYTRKFWKFAGWATNADGSGTFVPDRGTITNSNIGKLDLYAQWYDDTPPLVDDSISSLVNACKLDDEGNVPWTNEAIPVTIKASDDAAGLDYIGLFKNGTLIHKIGGDLNGAFNVTIEYKVEKRYLASEKYSIRVYDRSGNYSETFFHTECYDDEDPYPVKMTAIGLEDKEPEKNYGNICEIKSGVKRVDDYEYDVINVKVADNVSGVKEVRYSVKYKDKWCKTAFIEGKTTETEFTIELPKETCPIFESEYDPEYSLTLKIEDNAGNVHNGYSAKEWQDMLDKGFTILGDGSVPCNIMDSTKSYITEVQLVDYSYVFRIYDEEMAKGGNYVERFLSRIDKDTNLACKSAAKFIQNEINNLDPLKVQDEQVKAVNKFLEVYNYDLYKSGLK